MHLYPPFCQINGDFYETARVLEKTTAVFSKTARVLKNSAAVLSVYLYNLKVLPEVLL